MIPFFIDFVSILDPSWRPSWSHVGAMLATNPQKSDFENNTKKTPKTEGPGPPRDSPEMRSWGPLIIQKTTLSRLQIDNTHPHS